MRIAGTILVAVLAATPSRPLAAQASPSAPVPSRDERFGIRSAVLGEDREVLVHLPEGARSGERFDVVYVLDGTALLPLVAGMADYRVMMQIPPKVIVVGITNRSSQGRGKDFTPVVDTTHRDWFPVSGGADTFLRFLESEVIPTVEARYPVTRHRTIIGHSLSALFVLHALAARPDLFERYIAVSPTIPWAGQAIITELGTKLPTLNSPLGLYVSVGNEQDGYPEGLDRLEALLRRAAPASLRWKVERFPQYDHTATVPPAVHAGLMFVYPSSN
ncbi:MAG TPA: alpha/beta hydrolase-fold protein [Gemmatimonadales bacterium]|nr:alpha/beta hydrolase-fold protein [Gemmatimonadales bacterium]